MREGHPTDEHFNALASSGKINLLDKKLNIDIVTLGAFNRKASSKKLLNP